MRTRMTLAAVALAAAIAQPAPAQTPLSPRPPAVPAEANPPGPSPLAPLAAPRGAPAAPPARAAAPRRNGPTALPPMPAAEAPAAGLTADLARDLDAAMALDAGGRGLLAGRDAVRARDALVRSPIPGAPSIGGNFRADTRGFDQAREGELEVAAPLWLPGQRGALSGTVEAGVAEAERRFALRRLEVAGLLRDAYWAVGEAEAERRVARDRLATARDIARDFSRRAELGDISATEALLGRNEVVAAELELARADAAAAVARTAYRALTGGAAFAPGDAASGVGGLAGARSEPMPPPPPLDEHPGLVAAEASLEAAEARARLVAATPRDNPEIGLFGRTQAGPLTEDGTSLGIRFRLPLATEARNAPRRAEAEAERTRALAELEQARRLLESGIAQARTRLAAAQSARRLAAERRSLSEEQLRAARTAFANGEIGAFDLFRVRQLQLDAQAAEAAAAITLGRARSVLNQALGVVPGG
jgi:outer membrane protein TolC